MRIYCTFCGAANLSTSGGGGLCRRCGHLLETENEKGEYHLQNDMILHHVYKVVALLGEGGFGITYKAFDEQTARFVAIKELYSKDIVRRNVRYSVDVALVYDIHMDDYEKTKKRFIEEAKALMQFRGERGIVQILDYFEENNTAYIVMNYLDGMTLKEYIRKSGTCTWERTYELLYPVMESLVKIHEKGFVHQDISSSNIMVIQNDELVLLDFGSSKMLQQKIYTDTSVFAKKGYTPIEQYSENGEIGAWTDVYALTSVFYECVTGETPPDSLQRVIYDEYQPIRSKGYEVPKEIEEIIAKGIAIRVEERFCSVREFMEAFEKVSKIQMKRKHLFLVMTFILLICAGGLVYIIL